MTKKKRTFGIVIGIGIVIAISGAILFFVSETSGSIWQIALGLAQTIYPYRNVGTLMLFAGVFIASIGMAGYSGSVPKSQ